MSDQGCCVKVTATTFSVAGAVDAWERCGAPCVAKNLCARHYQQDRRGRLGKTKEIAAPGEAGQQIKTTLSPEALKKLKAKAKAEKVSVSEIARALIIQGLG